MSPMNLKTALKKDREREKTFSRIVSHAKTIANRTDPGHKELLRIDNKNVDLEMAAQECWHAGISCRKALGGIMISGWRK